MVKWVALSPLERDAVSWANEKSSLTGEGAFGERSCCVERRVRLFFHRTAIYEAGSNPKTRNSCRHRQAFAMRAAHATASSREGNSSTRKPPLRDGAHG